MFFLGFKCPVCSKSVASNEMEVHFIMCLSKPRLSYNGEHRLCLFLSHDRKFVVNWRGKLGTKVNNELILALVFQDYVLLFLFIGSSQYGAKVTVSARNSELINIHG